MSNKSIISFTHPLTTPYIMGLLLISFISLNSCVPAQYGFDAQSNSKFATFSELGIDKDAFIHQYGMPTNKGLHATSEDNVIEKLYYTEKIRSFLVTTLFVFENNVLVQMERVETGNNPQEILEQLERIR